MARGRVKPIMILWTDFADATAIRFADVSVTASKTLKPAMSESWFAKTICRSVGPFFWYRVCCAWLAIYLYPLVLVGVCGTLLTGIWWVIPVFSYATLDTCAVLVRLKSWITLTVFYRASRKPSSGIWWAWVTELWTRGCIAGCIACCTRLVSRQCLESCWSTRATNTTIKIISSFTMTLDCIADIHHKFWTI